MVSLHRANEPGDSSGFAPGYYLDFKQRLETTSEVSLLTSYIHESATLFEQDEVVEIDNVIVADGDYFGVVGARALLGRLTGPDDVIPGQVGDSCVISETLWRSRFDADDDIVGRKLILDERAITVVGVLPGGLPLSDTQIWLNQGWSAEDRTLTGRLNVLARLTGDVPIEVAEPRFASGAAELAPSYPRYADYTVSLQSFRETLIGDVRPALMLAAATVGLILLIACANLANLLLARAATREREMATRRALGARLSQVLSQLLSESVVLALIGGAAGVGLAFLLHRLLLAFTPSSMPRTDAVQLDLPVLAFAAGISMLAGIVFGLAPVFQTFELNLSRSMSSGIVSGDGARRGSTWLRHALVIGQLAVAVTLLVAASLMLKSFLQLRAVDPGFKVEGLGMARVYLDGDAYPDDAEEAQYFRSLLERLDGRGDIASAGASSGLPMDPFTIDYDLPYTLPGQPPSDEEVTQAFFRTITPGYIETMQIPLMAGRTFDSRDRADSELVALVNESFARLAWPDGGAVGESFSIYGGSRQLRVVGVVG